MEKLRYNINLPIIKATDKNKIPFMSFPIILSHQHRVNGSLLMRRTCKGQRESILQGKLPTLHIMPKPNPTPQTDHELNMLGKYIPPRHKTSPKAAPIRAAKKISTPTTQIFFQPKPP
jgi:hypothetical protein